MTAVQRLINNMKSFWQGLRRLSGEDAYDRYLLHWQQSHQGGEDMPLDRKAFYKDRQERKWNGIKRCC